MRENNPNAWRKICQLSEWGISFKNTHNGIIIDDKIMIAKNKSRWPRLDRF